MSKWTHSICAVCWAEKNPQRVPVRATSSFVITDTCCVCGMKHESGIYFRQDPMTLRCKGVHT